MYLEELTGVAIGLILVYILISVAVMSFQEWIAGMLNKRANDLEDILREMLAEALQPVVGDLPGASTMKPEHSSGMLEKIYSHPLVKSLRKGTGKPSYIPADIFVLALFDTVMTAGSDSSTINQALEKLKAYTELVPQELRVGLETGIAELQKKAGESKDDPIKLVRLRKEIESFTQQYTDYDLDPIFDTIVHSLLPVTEARALQALRRGADMLTVENVHLKQTLDDFIQQAETFIKEGENKLEMARAHAEKWFNDTMDRASGWYKRSMQVWALTIGICLAILLNVDTIEIATRLWIQPALRQSLVKAAEIYQLPAANQPGLPATNPVEIVNRMQSTLAGLQLPVGWTFESLGPGEFNPAADRCTLFLSSPTEAQVQKEVIGLPVNGTCKRWTNPPRGWGILTKLLGIAITGVAAMQGAPFWFEILKKIVNVRSSGAKPEEKKG